MEVIGEVYGAIAIFAACAGLLYLTLLGKLRAKRGLLILLLAALAGLTIRRWRVARAPQRERHVLVFSATP